MPIDHCTLSERKLAEIVDRYDQATLRISNTYADGGTDPLWPRFSRSVGNQMDNGPAALSRYAIWANTVRDNIIKGIEQMQSGDAAAAQYHLIRAANSLSAFSDVQAYFDPMEMGKRR